MTFQDRSKYAKIAGLLHSDSYKLQHRHVAELAQTPAGTMLANGATSDGSGVTRMYSNWTNRGSRIAGIDKVVHFGLQAALVEMKELWAPFFEADEDEVIELYRERLANFVPADADLSHIRKLHRIGYLPLEFKAVPEGTRVPLRVPSFTIENTHPDAHWLTNYVETYISASIWQASTTATKSHHLRTMLNEWAVATGATVEDVNFQGHDFSARGMSSPESSALSGAGHLLNFNGTDSIVALDWIDQNYGGEYLAASVPATEHSVMCAGAAVLGERELFSRILDLHPTGIVSVVSDTFDLWKVLTEFLPSMHDKIMARDGKLVIRPDSGNPVDILCGTTDTVGIRLKSEAAKGDYVLRPSEKGVIELLWDEFGGTVNEAGYKVLDSHVGTIYGDSITHERANEINERLAAKGFASINWVAGCGSFAAQYVTRDTFGSAIKATWIEVDGQGYDLQKDPVTDNGLKKSAKGRLAVHRDEAGELYLIEQATPEQEAASELKTVWKDGEFVRRQTFADVRETLANS